MGRRWADGQTESVMEAHSSNERKSVERGEHEASTGQGTASRALTPPGPTQRVRHCRTYLDFYRTLV